MNENPNNEATSAARPDPLKDAIADSVNREKTRTAKGLLKEISSAETDTEAAGTLSRLDKALDELPPEMISSLEGTFIDVMNISEREIGKAREAYEFSLREVVNETLLAREGRNLFEMSKDERAAYFAAIVDEQEIARRNRDTIKRGAAAVLNPELVSRQAVSANLYAGTLDTLWKVVNALTAFCNSKIWDLYDRLFPDMRYYFKGIQPQQESILDAFALLEFCVELDAAAPFAEEETNAFKEKTGAEFITFRDFTEKVLPACLDRAHKAIFKTDESDVEALTKELAELSSVETLKSISPSKYAESKGAIMTIGERLMILSDPDYQYSFITDTGAKYGLRILSGSGDNEERGELAFNINVPFLQSLLKAVYSDTIAGGSGDIFLYWPYIAKELGIDATRNTNEKGERQSRKQARKQTLEGFIIEVQKLFAPVPGLEGYMQVISVPWYDPETEMLKFSSPYMRALLEQNMQRERKSIEGGKHSANWHCDLMHASAANEKNKAAVEMAQRILVGIQQRGTTNPESKLKKYKGTKVNDSKVFEWHISCKGLILDCPQIRNQLDRQKSNSGRTQALHRAFTAMYRILRKKTDLFGYYKDLTITEIIPTFTTLNDTNAVIHIQHYGRNPKYTQPQITLPKRTEPATEDAAPQQ